MNEYTPVLVLKTAGKESEMATKNSLKDFREKVLMGYFESVVDVFFGYSKK